MTFDTLSPQGHIIEEVHADGGGITQVFLFPAEMTAEDIKKKVEEMKKDSFRVFVILNNRHDAAATAIDTGPLSVARKTISSLIRSQARDKVREIWKKTKDANGSFRYACISSSRPEAEEEFDNIYMQQLFEDARFRAKKGYPWLRTPPNNTASNIYSKENSQKCPALTESF